MNEVESFLEGIWRQ